MLTAKSDLKQQVSELWF